MSFCSLIVSTLEAVKLYTTLVRFLLGDAVELRPLETSHTIEGHDTAPQKQRAEVTDAASALNCHVASFRELLIHCKSTHD